MANLGKLWFELGMRDKTDKDIAEIRKGIEKRLKDLNVDIGLNGDSLRRSIEAALAGRQFKVGILVDKANATKAVQDALAKAGYTTSIKPDDVRAARIAEINRRIANSYEESQAKVKKLQAQIDRLRVSHERAASSANKYSLPRARSFTNRCSCPSMSASLKWGPSSAPNITIPPAISTNISAWISRWASSTAFTTS